MRCTLVGTGYWGRHYARILSECFDLRWIVDTNAETLAPFQTLYPKSTCTTDLSRALGSDVDVVCIVTPASTHFALARQCLLAKKHVFVEKPLTIDPEHSAELVRLADASGLRLMTGFTFLFVPAVVRAREMLPDIGRLYYMTSRRTNLGPVRRDVSVVWDLVPHDIAVFCAWDPSPVVSVSAVGSTFLSSKPDAVTSTLQFASGAQGSIFASWAEPRKVRELVLVGSDATIVVDDVDVKAPLTVYRKGLRTANLLPPADEFGSFKLQTSQGDMELPALPAVEPLRAKLQHLALCVRDPSYACQSDGRLGHRVTQILHAIDRSIANGGAPVNLTAEED